MRLIVKDNLIEPQSLHALETKLAPRNQPKKSIFINNACSCDDAFSISSKDSNSGIAVISFGMNQPVLNNNRFN